MYLCILINVYAWVTKGKYSANFLAQYVYRVVSLPPFSCRPAVASVVQFDCIRLASSHRLQQTIVLVFIEETKYKFLTFRFATGMNRCPQLSATVQKHSIYMLSTSSS